MFSSGSKTIEVSVRTLDEATLRGTISLGQSGTLEGALSKETPFLEFISKDGQRKFIAKHQIAYIEPVEPLRKPTLKPQNDPRFVDAFQLLGVHRGCSFSDAKIAFHTKAKQYHPDTYSGVNLPVEIHTYLEEMFKQINTAFTEVRAEFQNAA